RATGQGLRNIRQRAQLRGAHVDSDSEPGRGARVAGAVQLTPRGTEAGGRRGRRSREPAGAAKKAVKVQHRAGKWRGVRVKPIRVVIVDDHEVVRLGLKTLLTRVSDLEVVGEAGSATEAEEVVAATQPDVVIMDIRMPGGSGIEACRVIRSRWPEVKVI